MSGFFQNFVRDPRSQNPGLQELCIYLLEQFNSGLLPSSHCCQNVLHYNLSMTEVTIEIYFKHTFSPDLVSDVMHMMSNEDELYILIQMF